MEIGTFIAGSVDSELSGNVIDLCPVGALTSKPFRFRARAWEMAQRDGIAPHDPVGSNIHLHVRRGPGHAGGAARERSDQRGVDPPTGTASDTRACTAKTACARRWSGAAGAWHEVSWEEALDATAAGLREVVTSEKGAAALGALASASCTAEELYLFQHLVRGLGSANVDHRVRQRDFSDQDAAPGHPSIGMGLADLERLDAALLIGSCTRKEHPIVNHRLRKASLAGAAVAYLDVMAHDLNLAPAARMVVPPPALAGALAAVTVAAARIAGREPEGLGALAEGIGDGLGGIGSVGTGSGGAGGIGGAGSASAPGDVENVAGTGVRRLQQAGAERIARALADAGRGAILLGPQAVNHRDAAALRGLAACLADLTGATLGTLDEGANPAGAWVAGALPHRGPRGAAAEPRGLDARAMIEADLDAWLLMGLEPELDCADGARAREALGRARFVVSLAAFRSEAMSEYAHVILPAAAFAETEGNVRQPLGNLAELRRRGASLRGCASGVAGAAGPRQPPRPSRLRTGDDRGRACGARRAGGGRGLGSRRPGPGSRQRPGAPDGSCLEACRCPPRGPRVPKGSPSPASPPSRCTRWMHWCAARSRCRRRRTRSSGGWGYARPRSNVWAWWTASRRWYAERGMVTSALLRIGGFRMVVGIAGRGCSDRYA